ncbi:cell division protein ZapA [Fulvivirga sp. M361]|uniref:cell division protein ZapA n=1 Tax=Fulvivirga sp. M361 TaxID=2594266 RepID=UPI00117B7349|nr:cell division protein ZapA [Fulvivirga sp. M361]TRX49220.1 cell division protein ZapA [Fulvivirga sp. M361]
MDILSIKIKIADREYPMKVKPEDEERVRKAGKKINERLRSYREQFGINDNQDLLAMVAFDSLVDKLEMEDKQLSADDSATIERIEHLNKLISKSL